MFLFVERYSDTHRSKEIPPSRTRFAETSSKGQVVHARSASVASTEGMISSLAIVCASASCHVMPTANKSLAYTHIHTNTQLMRNAARGIRWDKENACSHPQPKRHCVPTPSRLLLIACQSVE